MNESILTPLLNALTSQDAAKISAEGRRVLAANAEAAAALMEQMVAQLHQRGADALLLPFYRALIDVLPDAVLWQMLKQAQALTVQGHIRHAAALLELVRTRSPQDPGIAQQLVRRLQMLGEDEKAMSLLEEIMRQHPEDPQLQYMHVVARMIRSQFKDGTDEYDIRFHALPELWREIPFPRWRGEALAGKRLYIWNEQGIGDLFMFATFLPYLQSLGAEEICMGVPARAKALMERSYPGVRFIEETEMPEACDFQMPLADMLRYCLPHYTPREHAAKLVPHPALLADVKASLARLGPQRKIGISWFTTNKVTAPVRDIPLEQWAPVFSVPNCLFVSLQHGEGVPQMVQTFAQQTGFPLLADPTLDPTLNLEALVALTAALDAVISIQATAGHIGGGLGVPTTVLSSKARDFAWAFDPCPWYNSVQIMRQQEAENWGPAMQQVAEGLRGRVGN